MKILMISSYLPYPLFSGGHIRLYNLLKGISQRHEITLICEKRDYQTQEDIGEVGKICKRVITVERKKQWTFMNVLKTGFSKDPFLVVGHTNNEMKSKISEEVKGNKFDLIHVETFYVIGNLPQVNVPIILVEHNIEFLVYQRLAGILSPVVRPLLYMDIIKLRQKEKQAWRRATKLVAVSKEEKKLMKRDDVMIVPNGVNTQEFKIQNSKFKIQDRRERIVLFIGDFRWIQNRDAVVWMLKEIWPEICAERKVQSAKFTLKLWIVGRKIPDSIKKLTSDRNVIFHENAPYSTWEIFNKADVLLAPIRVGGGTSFKILEAMASGVPVVTTHLGIEGIEATNGRDVLIADDAEKLAKGVVELLLDDNLHRQILIKGRKLMEEKYDWEKIVKKLEDVYRSAFNTNAIHE